MLSPVLKRLRPTPIPVSDNPAQAKGSKCLGKTAGGRRVGPITGNYVTHSLPHSTNPSPRRGSLDAPPRPIRGKVQESASAAFGLIFFFSPCCTYSFPQKGEREKRQQHTD